MWVKKLPEDIQKNIRTAQSKPMMEFRKLTREEQNREFFYGQDSETQYNKAMLQRVLPFEEVMEIVTMDMIAMSDSYRRYISRPTREGRKNDREGRYQRSSTGIGENKESIEKKEPMEIIKLRQTGSCMNYLAFNNCKYGAGCRYKHKVPEMEESEWKRYIEVWKKWCKNTSSYEKKGENKRERVADNRKINRTYVARASYEDEDERDSEEEESE